jgi:hypothetical protein
MTLRPVGGPQPPAPGGPQENVPELARQFEEPVRKLAKAFAEVLNDPMLAHDKATQATIADAVQTLDQLIPRALNL